MLKPNDAEKLAKALFRLTVPSPGKGKHIIRAACYDNRIYVTDAYVCARLTCERPYDAEALANRVAELQGAYTMVHKNVPVVGIISKEAIEEVFTPNPSDRHDATLAIKLLDKVISVAKCISPCVNLECHGNEAPTALYTFGDGLRLDAIQMPVRERKGPSC